MIVAPTPQSLRAHWWVFLVRAVVALLFALVCFLLTGAAIVALILWIGVFFVIDGILMIVGAVRNGMDSHHSHWWWQAAGGVIGIAAGIVTFEHPAMTAVAVTLLVAIWAVATGILELATAIRLRRVIPNEWMWIVNGLLSILLGAAIFLFPAAGLVALVWLLGFYSLLAGIAMAFLAFRLRAAR